MNTTKYDTRYEFRCFKSDLKYWRKMAAENNMSLSDYVRACLNEGKISKHTQHTDPALIRQISAIGNNINQIAYWVNTYKSKADAELVAQRLEIISKDTKILAGKTISHDD